MRYKDAGVDVDLGEELIKRIKSLAESTFGPRVLRALGGFSACYSLDCIEYRDPVLVASTDFSFLLREGHIPEEEMWRTFNNGIGMILVVKADEAERVLTRLRELGEVAYLIGEVSEAGEEGERVEFT